MPAGVTPGRKLQVTVSVPEGFSKLLVVESITVNGTPVPTCSGCGVRVEEGARWCEACRGDDYGRLVVLGPVVDYVRGAGIAADRKVSEAANKCIGFGHDVVRVYLQEESPPGPVVGNPRWINGRMSIQPKDTSAFAQLRDERKDKEVKGV